MVLYLCKHSVDMQFLDEIHCIQHTETYIAITFAKHCEQHAIIFEVLVNYLTE